VVVVAVGHDAAELDGVGEELLASLAVLLDGALAGRAKISRLQCVRNFAAQLKAHKKL